MRLVCAIDSRTYRDPFKEGFKYCGGCGSPLVWEYSPDIKWQMFDRDSGKRLLDSNGQPNKRLSHIICSNASRLFDQSYHDFWVNLE